MKKKIALYKLFPSMITMLALCMGMTAIKYTVAGNFEMAVIMVLVACFMDGIDGSTARLLKSTSTFGAQLDSLADLVSFGVTPAIIVYYWKLKLLGGFGWAIALVYAICTALRLARYNVSSADTKNHYFEGISSTCGAILILTPLISTFQILNAFNEFIVCCYTFFMALMLISSIPTISTKAFSIQKNNITFILAILAMLVAAIFLMPWITIPILAICDLISIPFTWFHYRKKSLFKD